MTAQSVCQPPLLHNLNRINRSVDRGGRWQVAEALALAVRVHLELHESARGEARHEEKPLWSMIRTEWPCSETPLCLFPCG